MCGLVHVLSEVRVGVRERGVDLHQGGAQKAGNPAYSAFSQNFHLYNGDVFVELVLIERLCCGAQVHRRQAARTSAWIRDIFTIFYK